MRLRRLGVVPAPVLILCSGLGVWGCSSAGNGKADGAPTVDSGVDAPPPRDAGGDGSVAGDVAAARPTYCNPLTVDHCFLPWPSSYFLKQDAATKTGFRVAYPPAVMPTTKAGLVMDPARYNELDGFSAGSQPLAYFESGVSKEGLPGIGDAEGGTGDTSPVWIYDMTTGERVPLFAEIDANATPPFVGALIIRPLAPLQHDTRHVVVLRDGLKTASGVPLPPPAPFRQLRDGTVDPDDAVLAAEAERMMPVLEFLRERQVDLEHVVLAWDFHTASHEAVTGPLVGMVDEALAKLPADGPSYALTKVTEHPADTHPHLWFEIEGEMEVPSFLESEDPDAWLNRDADGRPLYRAPQKFHFRVTIPRCAATAAKPLPIVIYGHGLFGGDEALTYSHRREMFDRFCVVAAATDWRGFAEADKSSVASKILTDFSNVPRITDPLHQAHVNFQALVELMRGKLLADDAMKVGGVPVADGQELYYIGISLGGIQGTVFAALGKRIVRHVLNVPGGWWSQMMQRASGFKEFAAIAAFTYGSPTLVLTAIHLSQSLFDYTDPITFASHVISDPLPGRPAKRIVYQEALWDDAVPNIATRAIVRAAGLPLLKPPYESVYGVEELAGPLPSAYVQWETAPGAMPPEGNVPAASLETAESPHEQVRRTESFYLQVEKFLQPDGLVEQTCDGVCTVKES